MISCDGGRCTVQGPITLDNTVALLARGNELFAIPQVTVDLGAVTEVDSSALSLLLEWRREAGRHGRTIRYLNLPANLKSLAQLYGVTELLGNE
ncbi:MAG: STAS domain-containing protein [Betaproteobacteria bacterium]|nr:STAS domain-containing protein [Betaproteobacteria bacterium]